jgi:hypothetical protein
MIRAAAIRPMKRGSSIRLCNSAWILTFGNTTAHAKRALTRRVSYPTASRPFNHERHQSGIGDGICTRSSTGATAVLPGAVPQFGVCPGLSPLDAALQPLTAAQGHDETKPAPRKWGQRVSAAPPLAVGVRRRWRSASGISPGLCLTMSPESAPVSCTALSMRLSRTSWRLKVERLIVLRTWAVAVSRRWASSRSACALASSAVSSSTD